MSDVRLQESLAQPGARPVRELCRTVCRQAPSRPDVAGGNALDLGHPKDGSPPFGQRSKGLGGERGVLACLRFVRRAWLRSTRIERATFEVGSTLVLLTVLIDRRVARRDEQIRPERRVGIHPP